MSQFDFGTIDPATKNGTELAADLNSWRTALHTQHRGSGRPSYADTNFGGLGWLDDSSDPVWVYRIHNGLAPASDLDVPIFTMNKTTGAVTFSMTSLIMGTFALNTTQLQAVRTGATPTQDLVFFEDDQAANNFSNVRLKANRPGFILQDTDAAHSNFRFGIDQDLLKISVDTNEDLAKDGSGHFTDVPNALVLSDAGSLGLGKVPTSLLHLASISVSSVVTLERIDGTINEADEIGSIEYHAGEGDSTVTVGKLACLADEVWSGSTSGTRLGFYTTPSGSLSAVEVARLTEAGDFGLGNTAPEDSVHVQRIGEASLRLHTSDSGVGATASLFFKTRAGVDSDAKGAVIFEGTGGSWGRGALHLCMETTDDATKVDATNARLTINNIGDLLIPTNSFSTTGFVRVDYSTNSIGFAINPTRSFHCGVAAQFDGFLGLGNTDGVTITNPGNEITVTRSNLRIIANAATAPLDDLETITGGAGGDFLILHPSGGETITIKDSADNIFTADGNDVVLSGREKIFLIQGSAGAWNEVGHA